MSFWFSLSVSLSISFYLFLFRFSILVESYSFSRGNDFVGCGGMGGARPFSNVIYSSSSKKYIYKKRKKQKQERKKNIYIDIYFSLFFSNPVWNVSNRYRTVADVAVSDILPDAFQISEQLRTSILNVATQIRSGSNLYVCIYIYIYTYSDCIVDSNPGEGKCVKRALDRRLATLIGRRNLAAVCVKWNDCDYYCVAVAEYFPMMLIVFLHAFANRQKWFIEWWNANDPWFWMSFYRGFNSVRALQYLLSYFIYWITWWRIWIFRRGISLQLRIFQNSIWLRGGWMVTKRSFLLTSDVVLSQK